MSQKRIRKKQTAAPTPPYWKSILASFLLVLAMMFWFEFFSNPRSGELRRGMMAPVFALFAVVVAGVFYAEFKLHKKRPQRSEHNEELR